MSQARPLYLAGLAVAVSTCAAFAGAASAAEPPKYVMKDGVAQFDHVRVVNAPIASSAGTLGAGGLKAFVDPETGQLRQPNAEELQQMAAEQPATAQALGRSSRVQPVATRTGGVRIYLDESHMQYSVITRHADGTITEACVTGEDAASELARAGIAKPAAGKGETR